MIKRSQLKWLLPLAILAILAPFSIHIDPWLSSCFFHHEHGFSKALYHYFIFNWAVIPALAIGITSGVIFLFSFFFKRLYQLRLPCLFLALSMLLGAGIMTHVILKGFWFRPRPIQTVLFGGTHLFSPFYLPKFSFPNLCKSFPSGHATMGFYFINLLILGFRLKMKPLIYLGSVLTAIFSFLLGFSRIAQGAHFLSDVFMSLIVTWYAALVVEKLVFDYLAKKKPLSYIKD